MSAFSLRPITPGLLVGLLLALWSAGPPLAAQSSDAVRLRRLGTDPGGQATAVVVEQGALVHTALMLPVDADGALQGRGDASAQARVVLRNLEIALQAAGTRLDQVARLHVYVADASVTASVDRVLAERFGGASRPAVTTVASRMAGADVLVAMDAVAVTARREPTGVPARIAVDGLARTPGLGAHVAVQPAGPFVIVSGRAAPGDFDTAVRGTIAQLRSDLAGVGLTLAHAVHVKAFLSDMTRVADLQRLVAEAFPGTAPPLVVTEWHGASLPVEIELIATAPAASSAGERLTFVEPIMSRYSRVARVFAGQPIFVSGLTGSSPDPATQVREVFGQLRRVLESAGSDMRHIAKTTYYVSDKTADQEINTVRPSIYDAARPPAASKISVQATGRTGAVVVVDAIALTVDR